MRKGPVPSRCWKEVSDVSACLYSADLDSEGPLLGDFWLAPGAGSEIIGSLGQDMSRLRYSESAKMAQLEALSGKATFFLEYNYKYTIFNNK